MKEKKVLSHTSTYDMKDDDSNNSYLDDSYDFSDGEDSTGSQGLNDDGDEDDLYVDDGKTSETMRQQEGAKANRRKNQAKERQSAGGLEALFSQTAPPPRIKSIGVHGERELEPVRRTRPAAQLRSRSGGVKKVNRKISRAVKDAGRGVVGATAMVAEGRGRELVADIGEKVRSSSLGAMGEKVRSSSLGAMSRKLTSRAERKAAKEAAEGGVGNLSLDDHSPKNSPKRTRNASIGAVVRRGPMNRRKSVGDKDILEGELNLNDHSPSRSPSVRGRQRGGSLGAISTKARRERWKSVDDAEDLLDADGEFELKLDDEPKSSTRKERNSIGTINVRTRRDPEGGKLTNSSDGLELERKGSRSKSRDKKKNEDGQKRVKRKGKKKSSKAASFSDDSDSDSDGVKRKGKKKSSKAPSFSDDSDSDGEKKPRRKLKKSASKAPDDGSSDEGEKKPKGKTTRVKSADKLRKKASKSPKDAKKKSLKKNEELDLNERPIHDRRMKRRSSTGEMEQTANEILKRTQAADQRWDAHKDENSVLERRMRRRASLGTGENVRGREKLPAAS